MSTMGNAMPPALRAVRIRAQIAVGCVVKLVRTMDDGREHEKRWLIAEVDAQDVYCFVINSELTAFARNAPRVFAAQVQMPVADHAFMERDSWVDCSKLWTFPLEAVVGDLAGVPEWVLGRIGLTLRDDLSVTLDNAVRTIALVRRRELIQSLHALS